MDRIGLDSALAAVVAVWFIVTGVSALASRPVQGRRAVGAEPTWLQVTRRVRGALEVLGGLAVAVGGVIGALGLRYPFPGRIVGFALSALALWRAGEAARPPVRWLRLALAAVGFALAVFYAGFRD